MEVVAALETIKVCGPAGYVRVHCESWKTCRRGETIGTMYVDP
jgi:hypothetical protein